MNKSDFESIVIDALKYNGGSTKIVEVAKYIWANYESELRVSGNIFYTWQYDMRWAATELRKKGLIKNAEDSPRGIWEIN